MFSVTGRKWARGDAPGRGVGVGIRAVGRKNAAPAEQRDREFADSPLEGGGFEPSVPRSKERTSGAKSDIQEEARLTLSPRVSIPRGFPCGWAVGR
jgi:hypothetical protein